MSMVAKRVLLIGASECAMIQSCLSAGHIPVAFDLFADWDAQQSIRRCPSSGAVLEPISDFSSLSERDLPDADIAVLSGGSERCGPLVSSVAQRPGLAGPPEATLQQFECQSQILDLLQSGGFLIPETLTTWNQDLGRSPDQWLLKPQAGCGGHRIVRWNGSLNRSARPCYWQRETHGESFAALLLSSAEGNCQLIGVTKQLVGVPWTHAAQFAYCGSIGPVKLPDSISAELRKAGQFLTHATGLQGVWGMDFLQVGQRPVLVDINPRITASAELFESSLVQTDAKSVLGYHLNACQGHNCDVIHESFAQAREGKVVLFQPKTHSLKISNELFDWLLPQYDDRIFHQHRCGRSLADLPKIGTQILPGHPLMTLRVRSTSEDETTLLEKLRNWADQIYLRCRQCTV